MGRWLRTLFLIPPTADGFHFIARGTTCTRRLGWKGPRRLASSVPGGSVADQCDATPHPETPVDLDTSCLGLDPALNRFHAPLVYHENYSFTGWPENHTFPVRSICTGTYHGVSPSSSCLDDTIVSKSRHFTLFL